MRLLTAAVLALVLPFTLTAQTTTGTVRGQVKSPDGATVAAADIEARNTETGVTRTTATRGDGSYIMPGLVPGTYEITARAIGSAPQRRQVVVQIGATQIVDFTLQAGAVELTAVTVEAASAVETRTSEVATNVSAAQIEDLPTPNRNFLELAALAPGVRLQGARLNDTRRTFAAGAQPAEAVNVFIDGASYKNDVLQGGVAGQDASRGNPFPLNAVREFRVITQNYKAEYQKASSAIITATTQSGTNEWAGNILLQNMGEQWMAQDPFAATKPELDRYLGAASVGGPIIRDRLHVFGSFEINRQDRSSTVDFPGTTADTVNLAPFEGTFVSPFRSRLFFGKLSYQLTPGQTLDFSFNSRHETDIRGFGGRTSRQAAENVKNDVNTGTLKHLWSAGAWLNEATATFQRYRWNPEPLDPVIGRDYRDFARIGGRDTRQEFTQDRLSLRNDVTYAGLEWGGQHVIKAGINLDFLNYDVSKEFTGNPVFVYINDPRVAADPNDDLTFAQPSEARYGFGNPDLSTSNRQLGLYLQDDWTPTPRLILNLGVRWDYESDMLNNDYVTPQAVRDSIRLPIFEDSVLFRIPDSYFTDGGDRPAFLGALQPRLGFSYALDEQGKTILFGGFGIFYDRHFYNAALDEKFRRQYKVLTFRFSDDGQPRDGFNTIQWNDTYLSKAGLDGLIASGLAPTPEVFLIDNDTKPPKSHQWSLGVRRVIGDFVVSATYTGVRGYNGLTYIFGNRRLNGNCCYQIPSGSFTNVLLSSDDLRTWYDALYLKVERPYRGGGAWAWGGGLAYTLSQAEQIGGDLFSLDFPTVTDYPRFPTGTDQRHSVVANWILDFPYAIQLSGVLNLGSGLPYNINDESQGTGPNERVFRRNAGQPDKYDFIIPNAWAYRNLDMRVSYALPRLSGTSLKLIVDIFNVFNYDNFGCYDGHIAPLSGSPNTNFGKPFCVISDQRRTQLGAELVF